MFGGRCTLLEQDLDLHQLLYHRLLTEWTLPSQFVICRTLFCMLRPLHITFQCYLDGPILVADTVEAA